MTKPRTPSKHTPTVADPATTYARSVISGESPAGPFVRDSCARHLRDLADGSARGLVWDAEAADRVISFFKGVLKLNGGKHEGVPFDPLPWQCFVLGSIFGWKNVSDGSRRFRFAFVLTGKGSGKSPLAAGIGMYCLTADHEPRAEVYAGASHREQAMILFRDAVAMHGMSPELSKRIQASGGTGRVHNLAHIASSSFFRVIASDTPQSGTRPHCALLDEIHEHHDSTLVDMLNAGMKGRRQALMFAITNAESSRTGVCAEYRDYAAKVASGIVQDDAFFAYVAALDEGDDPFKDEGCWAKANPSLGFTFGLDYLRRQVTQARGMPSKEAVVRRLNFCEPTDAVAHWIGSDLWNAVVTDFDIADMVGYPCFAGLDLSSKRDLSALALVWRHPDGRLRLACRFWSPGDTLAERAKNDNVPYPLWTTEGHMYAPPGRVIDKDSIAVYLQQIAAEHDLQTVAFDQAQIADFEAACERVGFDVWIDDGKDETREVGVRMLRHGQGKAGYNSTTTLWMPRSVGLLEDAVIAEKILIQRNPILTWNSASARLDADAQGNRTWDKKRATGKIDGMVAATMAVGAESASVETETGGNMWDRLPGAWDGTVGQI